MTPIENLVAISRKYGSDARYVIAGGAALELASMISGILPKARWILYV